MTFTTFNQMDQTQTPTTTILNFERENQAEAFDKNKLGVKTLVDSGLTEIPKIFIHPQDTLPNPRTQCTPTVPLNVPVIDLAKIHKSTRRVEIVEQICKAAESIGFFQMVNHGVPVEVMGAMIEAVRQFHEQPEEAKMQLYSRDATRAVSYYSNEDFQAAKSWRDTVYCQLVDGYIRQAELLPPICRKEFEEYIKCTIKLKDTLSELLSEALGLSPDYLEGLECMKDGVMMSHYYPPCPQPELTLGMAAHTDVPFLTILMQDSIGGLQVLHQNHWVDVPPIHGGLIANIGDLMQVITNNKFKSVEHRVVARSTGSRISVPCFFSLSARIVSEPIRPIKELLSPNNPPIYREVTFADYYARYKSKEGNSRGALALPHFMINNN
ncbi:hypothetical protein LguiA_004552 [Lonicera macranthoides]